MNVENAEHRAIAEPNTVRLGTMPPATGPTTGTRSASVSSYRKRQRDRMTASVNAFLAETYRIWWPTLDVG